MVTQHQVFLPPAPLASLSSSEAGPNRIHLHKLEPLISAYPQSLSLDDRVASQSQSLERGLSGVRPRKLDYGASSSHSRHQEASNTRIQGPEVKDNSQDSSVQSIQSNEAGPSKRRRSERLSRGANVTLPFAAGLNTTADSLLSLNTTTSDPSQFPPTADQTSGAVDTSISHLPKWHIPISRLTSLHTLLSTRPKKGRVQEEEKKRYNLILCLTSVDTPVVRQRKHEKAKGREGTLWISKWNVVAPPDGGEREEVGCEVKLWEGCAKTGDEKARRGDVVLVEGIEFRPHTIRDKAHLVLSPSSGHSPKITILYRTLPRYIMTFKNYQADTAKRRREDQGERVILPEDRALRPDLRLARSDVGIRKVAEYARWFATWVGGDTP